jgi:hypothetical protein
VKSHLAIISSCIFLYVYIIIMMGLQFVGNRRGVTTSTTRAVPKPSSKLVIKTNRSNQTGVQGPQLAKNDKNQLVIKTARQ